MTDPLTDQEKNILLRLAREAMEVRVKGKKLPALDNNSLTPQLHENGASFVTLTINAELRGCIGALEAYQPLAEDVREHAIAAALQDPRFPPVDKSELGRIRLEVSRLTAPCLLEYSTGEELLVKLNPHVDGVILKDGFRRATFLPQVWSQIPNPVDFLDHLCAKMGARKNLWRDTKLQVFVYQVEEFHEPNN
ncbi:AmmeMemoRadiSam system protein A [Candidatus Villigracilis saccharophilus]|jgi:AmmeMemoRadiSam system protein A|uniref:AmmeMemoRadiSam system protein A n=1 Tax=Candidatus Villigracilis saccharophilus TaxID=3140684 RepID=UPI003136FB88|nr:AmmeMemoRadiSam system protein A [Anaerolineales bacterium]